MASLREIRRKLHSVENIKKITQAMEMVAASHLRRAQSKAEMMRPYFSKLREMLQRLVLVTDDFVHPLVSKGKGEKIGVIVIAGDRGLCGSYNQNVFSATEKMLKNYPQDQVELILFGRKTLDHFSRKQWKIAHKIGDWGGKITYQQVEELTRRVIQQYLNGEFSEVWIVYTHYINIAVREVVVNKLLNIEFEESKTEKKKIPLNIILEPSSSEILTRLLPHYIIAKVQSALNEAYASELGARIFSMRAATKNAEEMKEKLTLVRNKIRQSSITRELLEITSCVESLK